MRISVFLLCACAAMATGCKNLNNANLVNGPAVVLDIEAAIAQTRVFDLGEITESIQFIALDNSVEVGEIFYSGGVKPAGDGFFVIDASEEAPVKRFDGAGKFISEIGRVGNGPWELESIVGVEIAPETGRTYVDGWRSVVAFDENGRGVARNDSVEMFGAAWHGDRLLVLDVKSPFGETAEPDSVEFIKILDRDLRQVGGVVVPNLGPIMGFSSKLFEGEGVIACSAPFIACNGKEMLIKQGRADTLYRYEAREDGNSGRLSPAYVTRLGVHAPPASVFGMDTAADWTAKHYSVDNVFEGRRWLIAAANNLQTDDSGRVYAPLRPLIFDREALSDGVLTGFTPTNGDGAAGLFLDGVRFTPCYIRDNELVGYISALDLAAAVEDNLLTRDNIRALASTLKEDDNPVVVIAKLKR